MKTIRATPQAAAAVVNAKGSGGAMASEIYLSIFSFVGRRELTALIRVSQSCAAMATECLWRTLDDPGALVHILKVLGLVNTGDHFPWWSNPPGSWNRTTWRRFKGYAGLVRSLNIVYPEAMDVNFLMLAEAAYIAGERLVPNLQRLSMTCIAGPLPSIGSFLSDRLQHITVAQFGFTSPLFPSCVAQCLESSTPALRSFAYSSTTVPHIDTKMLVQWLKRVPRLVELNLPPDCYNDELLEALGHMPELETLKTSWRGNTSPKATASFLLDGGSFPRLQQLWMTATMSNALQSLQTSPSFGQLKQVAFGCYDALLPGQLPGFISAFATACPSVEVIRLNLFPQYPMPDATTNTLTHPLPFSQFSPLFMCHYLKTLEVRSLDPIYLEEQDVSNMAQAWPRLHELELAQIKKNLAGRSAHP